MGRPYERHGQWGRIPYTADERREEKSVIHWRQVIYLPTVLIMLFLISIGGVSIIRALF